MFLSPLASITRISPENSTITIDQGDNQNFTVEANDQDGNLDFFEWYLDSDFQANHNASGYNAQDSWSHTFNTIGTYYVYVYIYDEENEQGELLYLTSSSGSLTKFVGGHALEVKDLFGFEIADLVRTK